MCNEWLFKELLLVNQLIKAFYPIVMTTIYVGRKVENNDHSHG